MLKKIYKELVPEKRRIDIRIGLKKMVAPVYYGDKFHCNCCKRSFRKFLPKNRPNASCPYCGSLERTRLLLMYLQKETTLFEQRLKVLHIAPERCLFDIFKKLDIEYIDGDINQANARHIVDLTDISYPDGYFDLIICSHVLAHIPDEAKAIQEMKRVLAPTGQTLVMTYIDPDTKKTTEDPEVVSVHDNMLNFGESDHLCRLHGADFDQILAAQGFKVEKIDYRQKVSAEVAQSYALGDGRRELIFKCTHG